MGIFNYLKKIGRQEEAPSLVRLERDSNLKLCCQQQIHIVVTIDEHVIEPMSSFIDINPEKEWIIIDQLIPEEGNTYIKRSDYIKISYIIDHIAYDFNSTYIKHINKDGFPALAIAYPEKIEPRQRRQFFRVKPSPDQPIKVIIQGKSDSDLNFTRSIIDISEGGISFAVKPDKDFRLELKKGKKLANINFSLPSLGVIKTKGIITGIFNSDGGKFYCGVKFIDLDDAHMSIIYKYVVSRQRDEMKKLNEEFES